MNPKVRSVRALPEYSLLLEFANGERRVFDVAPYLSRGVFERLRDPASFGAVRVVSGSVEWPGHIDLSYDTVYLGSAPA
jgi:hypothetical protein